MGGGVGGKGGQVRKGGSDQGAVYPELEFLKTLWGLGTD